MQFSLNYRFLLTVAGVLALFSGVISVALVLVIWPSGVYVPLWGQQSIATHLVAYSAVFGFVLGWVATKSTRRALQHSRVLPLHWHLKSQTLIDRLPAGAFNRAFILSLLGLTISLIMLLILNVQQLHLLPRTDYLVLSTVYAMLLAVAITTMSVYRALGDSFLHHSKV